MRALKHNHRHNREVTKRASPAKGGGGDSGEEEEGEESIHPRPLPALLATRWRKGATTSSRDEEEPLDKEEAKEDVDEDEDDGLSEGERRSLELARDKSLQAEIRAQETETARLERSLKQRLEKERDHAAETASAEERQCERSVKQLREALAELVVNREKQLQTLADCKQREGSHLAEQTQLEKEIRVYKDGLAAHRARIKDKQALHRIRLRALEGALEGRGGDMSMRMRRKGEDGKEEEEEEEEGDALGGQVSVLETACEVLSSEIAEMEKAAERELAEISSGHREELQRLDAKVSRSLGGA